MVQNTSHKNSTLSAKQNHNHNLLKTRLFSPHAIRGFWKEIVVSWLKKGKTALKIIIITIHTSFIIRFVIVSASCKNVQLTGILEQSGDENRMRVKNKAKHSKKKHKKSKKKKTQVQKI